jgi:hypothetical protein
MEQGDVDAEKLRRYVASQMSEAEFSDARRLVRLAAQLNVTPGVPSAGGPKH